MSILLYDKFCDNNPQNEILLDEYICPWCREYLKLDLECLKCHSNMFTRFVILSCSNCNKASIINNESVTTQYDKIRKYHGFYHYYPNTDKNIVIYTIGG